MSSRPTLLDQGLSSGARLAVLQGEPLPAEIVLVVDPFSSGSLYASRLARRGIAAMAILSSASVPAHFLKSFKAVEYSGGGLRALAEFERSSVTKPLAVIAGAETGVLAADRLAKLLGVAGNPINTSAARRNKRAMQVALADAGLAHIPSIVLPDRSEILPKVAECPFGEWVIKPQNSAASEGVVRGVGAEALTIALQRSNWEGANDLGERNAGFLIQPYITGPEYALDLVSTPGGVSVGGLCRYTKQRVNGGDFVYVAKDVLDPSEAAFEHIISYGRQALAALDCHIGPMHLEIIDSRAGPVLVEAGARLHGGTVTPQLFDHCYSRGLVDIALDAYLAGPAAPARLERRKAGSVVYLLSGGRGKFRGLSAAQLAYLESARTFEDLKLYLDPGDLIGPTIDLATCVGVVTFCGSDQAIVDREAGGFREMNIVELV